MPIVTAYLNGSTAGTPPTKNSHQRAKRGQVKGWSAGAVRRHTKWLYSVDADSLQQGDLRGYALTLTVRDCPPSAAVFHAMRKAWLMRQDRRGAVRLHWVIEWQRRGVPHIHAAVYFPAALEDEQLNPAEAALVDWVAIASDYGASFAGQYYDEISGPIGWLKYLSKHAARGARHYQRNGHPAEWDRTGRLWGHGGAWPTIDGIRYEMSMQAYHRYRRLIRAWRIADARAAGDPGRIAYARRMLACPERGLSTVRGVSDWVPEYVTLSIIDMLQREGFEVNQEELDS